MSKMNKFAKILLGSLILDAAIVIGAVVFVPRQDSCSFAHKYQTRSVLPISGEGENIAITLAPEKEADIKTKENKIKTLIFVGDIMLDRGVEYYTEKNGADYPFEKITDFLQETDMVFGNLEGPIAKKPISFPDNSLKFAFAAQLAESLRKANFGILSLANNHTLNMGQGGLEETRSLLKEANIDFAGDPVKCSEDFLLQKGGIVFLAFNKTFSFNCRDEDIIKTIGFARAAHPENFLAVSIHWGAEYKVKSSAAQKNLAHKMIDAGADLIIGQHPHVVQEAEKYNGKLIFYSLGNFIFDQSFSKNTSEGLAIKLDFVSNASVYGLHPVKIEKGQAIIMGKESAAKFLDSLGERSGEDLREDIKLGIIKVTD